MLPNRNTQIKTLRRVPKSILIKYLHNFENDTGLVKFRINSNTAEENKVNRVTFYFKMKRNAF